MIEIFGVLIVWGEERKKIDRQQHILQRFFHVHRYFSGWTDLDIIWEYILVDSFCDVSMCRKKYAEARKTDVYGKPTTNNY